MSNSIRMGFSERFRKALDEGGYGESQLQELGRLFEVSGQAVRKWLNGDSLPNSSRAPLVARKLGVRRAWLLDGEPPMRAVQLDVGETAGNYRSRRDQSLSISGEEYQLLNNYRSLPRHLRESVSQLIERINREIASRKRQGGD